MRLIRRLSPCYLTTPNGSALKSLLAEALFGLIASCECPGHVLLETLDRVSEWGTVGRVIVSGFHLPLEQQVLCSMSRRKGCVVEVLACNRPVRVLASEIVVPYVADESPLAALLNERRMRDGI
ncbi:hypothetical protein [Methylococcus mesophilus]|uniref:hypothetical protein n=1 Tax=Methylococcus mesophilus TaxID=2993564 RepID=UPI00224AE878|nr:hypothetical protein [Methylococcus mesophilus]UZR28508.1 hypothetical protein OOT43_17585 [Methylococcus mesophilus]